MPTKYSDHTKDEAMHLLALGEDISFIHFQTGVPERTLRYWRQKIRQDADCHIAEKTFPSAADRRPSEASEPLPELDSNYPPIQTEEAKKLLALGEDISFIFYRTGIPKDILLAWRQKIRPDSDCHIAEKTFPSAPDCRPSAEPEPLHATDANAATPAADAEAPNNSDIEDLTHIRERLMTYARKMADIIDPLDHDTNRRTLALARILDRIQWLDEVLPDRIPEQTLRFEYYYDGQVQEHPPWHGASKRYKNPSSDT